MSKPKPSSKIVAIYTRLTSLRSKVDNHKERIRELEERVAIIERRLYEMSDVWGTDDKRRN